VAGSLDMYMTHASKGGYNNFLFHDQWYLGYLKGFNH